MRNCSNGQGEAAQLHAEGKTFVNEMKIRHGDAVEEEWVSSCDERDGAASDPESVLLEAARRLHLLGSIQRILRILRS